MQDRYSSMEELFTTEPGTHYKLTTRPRPSSKVLVVSPHGGSIETLTSEIADAVAGDTFKHHDFAGKLASGNFARLHVTSGNYDCFVVDRLNRQSLYTMTIHGCIGKPGVKATYLGGKDSHGRELVREHLEAAGFLVEKAPANIAGMSDNNIVNRNLREMGIQLEISRAQRKELREDFAASGDIFHRYCRALREALSELSGESL